MTDQPAAAPSPGIWKIGGKPGDGLSPDIVSETGRGHFEVEILASLHSNLPKFEGTPEELWANAKLFAGAKATAAKCDRLVKANADLLAALIYADLQLRDHGQVDPKVRAALDEARKS